jgi:hypothetical protein
MGNSTIVGLDTHRFYTIHITLLFMTTHLDLRHLIISTTLRFTLMVLRPLFMTTLRLNSMVFTLTNYYLLN